MPPATRQMSPHLGHPATLIGCGRRSIRRADLIHGAPAERISRRRTAVLSVDA